MMRSAIYHVAPRLGQWTVEEEGGDPAATCAEKATAVRLAQELARVRHALLVLHRDDGTVHAEHRY
jgi:hypothetical protein